MHVSVCAQLCDDGERALDSESLHDAKAHWRTVTCGVLRRFMSGERDGISPVIVENKFSRVSQFTHTHLSGLIDGWVSHGEVDLVVVFGATPHTRTKCSRELNASLDVLANGMTKSLNHFGALMMQRVANAGGMRVCVLTLGTCTIAVVMGGVYMSMSQCAHV